MTENLKRMMLAFVDVDHDIRQVESKYNVGRADETVEKERLNFGLIEVVYEWARNKVCFSAFQELYSILKEIYPLAFR